MTAILVSPNETDQLAEKIIEVLANEKVLSDIGKAVRSYVEKFHDWNIVFKETLEILDASFGC